MVRSEALSSTTNTSAGDLVFSETTAPLDFRESTFRGMAILKSFLPNDFLSALSDPAFPKPSSLLRIAVIGIGGARSESYTDGPESKLGLGAPNLNNQIPRRRNA
jgi:hypothetical protein